jgi:putative Holliday junction resolvase
MESTARPPRSQARRLSSLLPRPPGLACYNLHAMRALGIDVGSKTIGVAVSDEDGVIATACEVLPRRGQDDDAAAIAARVRERAVGHVVVGLPLELDGREGRRARTVRAFVDVLARVLHSQDDKVEIVAWDERFSTASAERTMIEADASRAERKRNIDAVAAQFILQGWLDSRRTEARS